MDDEELLHITLKGLPKEYNTFRLAIRTKSTHVSFDDHSTMREEFYYTVIKEIHREKTQRRRRTKRKIEEERERMRLREKISS